MLIRVFNIDYSDGWAWIIIKTRNLGPKGPKKPTIHISEISQLISHCRMELGFRLPLSTNSNSYMIFTMVTFNLTSRDLERSNSRSQICQQPISHYWMTLGLRLPLNSNSIKVIHDLQNGDLQFDLTWPWKVKLTDIPTDYSMGLGLGSPLNSNSKSYICMTFKMVAFNLTLRDLERSNLRSRIF